MAAIRQQHRLSLTLLTLHSALQLELTDPLARALLLARFGFFLLWRPLWRGGEKLVLGQVGLIAAAAVLLIAAASYGTMALWISVLFSFIDGNIPGIKNFRQRVVSLFAANYLLSVLLTRVVPPFVSRPGIQRTVPGIGALRIGDSCHRDLRRPHRKIADRVRVLGGLV